MLLPIVVANIPEDKCCSTRWLTKIQHLPLNLELKNILVNFYLRVICDLDWCTLQFDEVIRLNEFWWQALTWRNI